MKRIFTGRQDMRLEAVLDRFVECRYCDVQLDAATGKRYAIRFVEGALYVNGSPWDDVEQWLRCLGLID